MVVFRKISRAKWEPINSSLIPSDGITADLRMPGNKLSLWRFDSASDENVEKVGLALASTRDSLAPIDIAWVDIEALSANIDLESTQGDTPVHSLNSFHVDGKDIDLDRLCLIAKAYFEAIRDGNHKRLAIRKVRSLIKSAIESGDLKVDALNEKLAKKFGCSPEHPQ